MDSIKIHVLRCGSVVVDSTLAFNDPNEINPFSYTGLFRSKIHEITLPVWVYLIEHPKGLVLVDTGWHSDVRDHMFRYLGPFLYMANKAFLPEGEAINEQLTTLGYKSSDIDQLVLTHLDCDHVSGLKLVSDAKRIIVSNIEYDGAMGNSIRYSKKMWEGVPMKYFYYRVSNEGPVQQSFDLFDDGSILLIYTPGHSKGMCSVKISNNDKFVLLVADCGYGKKSWEDGVLPGVVYKKSDMVASLDWVKKMADDPTCVEVLASHDTEVQPHVITL